MRNAMLGAGMIGVMLIAAPATAQEAPATAAAMSGSDVGVLPMLHTSASNYAAWAADSDMYEIQSSQLALSKAQSDAVKQFAREMIQDHKTTTASLLAALPHTNPRVPPPPKQMSADNQAKIAQLRAADGASFDSLYMQQQAAAHRQAWALHDGYATDGTDPALRQVATSAVPIIEKHLQHLKGMNPNGQ
jgi:putative membrane protein